MPRFEVEISAEHEAALREFVNEAGGTISKPAPSREEANNVWHEQTAAVATVIAASRAITDPDAKQRAIGGAVEVLKSLVFPEEFTTDGTPEAIYDNLLNYFAEGTSGDLPPNTYFASTQGRIVLKHAYKPAYGLAPSDIINVMETRGITDGRRKSDREVFEQHHIRKQAFFHYRVQKPIREYFAERGLITSYKYDQWQAQFRRGFTAQAR